MEKFESFIQDTKTAGQEFLNSFDKTETIHIVSHHDTDGLCSAAILEQSLEKEKISFITINLQQIDKENLNQLSKSINKKSTIIFTDIGSTNLDLISEQLHSNKIIILDHHKPNVSEYSKNIKLINPFVYDIDEENMISGSGIVYFFCQGINSTNKEYAYIAVLGAIGDTQENKGFQHLNNIILQHSILQKQIFVGKELQLYGKNSRPLIKVLEYSTDLNIPGLTNNYKGVIAFLKELRIPLYWKEKPRKWYQLKDFEKEAITEKIISLKPDVPIEDMTINTYRFNNITKRELKYGREFSTIINACGRLEEYRTAIDCLKNNETAQDSAINNLRVYKSSIHDALIIFEKAREEGTLIGNDKVIIFDTENKVKASIVGVIASIIARNKYYESGVIICSLSTLDENYLKISLRVSQDKTDLNLSDFLQQLVSEFGANAGGHVNAAGAIIPLKHKQEFIDKLISSV